MELHVHVGFGFHVNCYHSYRGDTNDALGFGGDIRIMRKTLDVLDDQNARGIPVKGTWDFENAYSLERILPTYAPDIIERVRKRQAEKGDENILMGYNNGAMSAMTEDEFMASVNWAVTNPYGSGLRDLFGGCEMIIRPQEVMFTPSQVSLYNRAGVKAICLYYSCISFDAFRTLIPPLSDELAFNPLRYIYKGEGLTVIPTYSPNDIMDAGSLRALVYELHDKQVQGEIKNDVFIFINTDADSFLWEPMAVPAPLQKMPCFGGIGGYIDEIADLDFVRFDTPGGYIKNHPPLKDIFFGQDVADGNLSGYMSWSEKPFNRLIWTRLERARAAAALSERDDLSPSFEDRVRLLSTTHFGLASPVMNITREETAKKLSAEMLMQEKAILPERNVLTLRDTARSSIAAVQLSLDDGFCMNISALVLDSFGLESWTACEMGRYNSGYISSVFLVAKYSHPADEYELKFSVDTHEKEDKKANTLSVPSISVETGCSGRPSFRLTDGRLISISGHIEHKSESSLIFFAEPSHLPLSVGGDGSGMRFQGKIHLPGEIESGSYTFDFFTLPGLDCIFSRCSVQYPYTPERNEISSQASNLGRYSDTDWMEVAPFELAFDTSESVLISKRNFMGDVSSYAMADFWRAFPQNRNISSINHQLTGGTLCAADDNGGILLAHSRQVLGSMAHCPIRLRTDHDGIVSVLLNPFGTYFGPQRYYPTRGNGSSMELYLAAAPQARSLAPAYNGTCEQSIQAIFGVSSRSPTDRQQSQAEAIADGMIVFDAPGAVHPFDGDNVQLHEAVGSKVDPKDLKSVTFVEQCGGVIPLLGIVKRYMQNLIRAQRRLRKLERKYR